jgi:hypothetical protein
MYSPILQSNVDASLKNLAKENSAKIINQPALQLSHPFPLFPFWLTNMTTLNRSVIINASRVSLCHPPNNEYRLPSESIYKMLLLRAAKRSTLFKLQASNTIFYIILYLIHILQYFTAFLIYVKSNSFIFPNKMILSEFNKHYRIERKA